MSNLAFELKQFTGTEQWYRHPLNQSMIFTDGVRHLMEKGAHGSGCFWFIDIVATEGMALHKKEPFVTVELDVHENETADLRMTDGNGKILLARRVNYTDMEQGTWTVWLVNNTALLPSEY